MSLPIVKDFFTNKVTIQIKSGQKFEGLLSQVDYKKQTITLEDVEDLGNSNDKNFIPHDKKIPQKIFQHEQISQILFKQKHFSEPKKYKQEQFWDAISEPVAKKYKQKNYQQRQKNDNYRGNRGRGGYYQKSYGDRDNRDRRDYRDNRDNRDNNRNYEKKSYNDKEGEYKGKKQNNEDRDYR